MKILLIEDEKELSNNIVAYLKESYLCEQAYTFAEAMEKLSLYTYDCILLDLTLPDGDGLKILDEIRNRNVESGVIIISAKNSLDDKINGLSIGADDYLPKPFSLSELHMRLHALIRRQNFSHSNIVTCGNMEINLLTKNVSVAGHALVLTKSEYTLLLFLIGNKNRVVSKNAIAEHLSGNMADMLDSHDFVYTHLKNLKAKLKTAGVKNHIKTIYGIGYQWVE